MPSPFPGMDSYLEGYLWPIALSTVLPIVPVPLQATDGDVLLDLRSALVAVYDEAAYHLLLDL